MITMVHDLTNPKTGKTYKEENLERHHKIPIGSLVERVARQGCLLEHEGAAMGSEAQ